MKRYEFKISIVGYGDNPDEAWIEACEGFSQDWGVAPDPSEYTIEEEER